MASYLFSTSSHPWAKGDSFYCFPKTIPRQTLGGGSLGGFIVKHKLENEENHGIFAFLLVPAYGTIFAMKRKSQKTLELIFRRPTVGNIKWRDIEAMFVDLGAETSEREGSRVGVRLFGDRRVFHRPHPSPDTDKGAVAAIRKWLEENRVTP